MCRFKFVLFLIAFATVLVHPSYAHETFGDLSDVVVTINQNQAKKIPPGVIGWGAMWKRKMLWPKPPNKMTDEEHRQYILKLGTANRPLIKQADVRNISWPWGVSFSTWAVNWENSIGPWTKRKVDCARILNRTAPWCEKSIVGVGDLMDLAGMWDLEAITVSVPLAVIDGRKTRWGPGFFNHSFSPGIITKISAHARALVDFMKNHPQWNKLDRIFLSAGCEWRHYSLKNPSKAVLSYGKLVKSIRDAIPEKKVIVVACASDGTDIPGVKHKQAVSWNKYLYQALSKVDGVALDLHRYRGMIGAKASKINEFQMSPHNLKVLLSTGLKQRGYLTVKPADWKEEGKPMPSVLLENSIHGFNSDHSKHSDQARPWPVTLAHADLVREALRSDTLTFLGWTWFPEALPPEWPHGALSSNGSLNPHAKAQAFLSHFHKGWLLKSKWNTEQAIRGNCIKFPDGSVRIYGGNFSLKPRNFSVKMNQSLSKKAHVELLGQTGKVNGVWNSNQPLHIPPLTLFRIIFSGSG